MRLCLKSWHAIIYFLLLIAVSQLLNIWVILHRWVLHEVLYEADWVDIFIGHEIDVHAVVILVLVHRFQVVVPLLIERLLLVVIPWHDVALSLEIESIL